MGIAERQLSLGMPLEYQVKWGRSTCQRELFIKEGPLMTGRRESHESQAGSWGPCTVSLWGVNGSKQHVWVSKMAYFPSLTHTHPDTQKYTYHIHSHIQTHRDAHTIHTTHTDVQTHRHTTRTHADTYNTHTHTHTHTQPPPHACTHARTHTNCFGRNLNGSGQ